MLRKAFEQEECQRLVSGLLDDGSQPYTTSIQKNGSIELHDMLWDSFKGKADYYIHGVINLVECLTEENPSVT